MACRQATATASVAAFVALAIASRSSAEHVGGTQKYLFIAHVLEGFGAWSDVVRESMMLAARLNRTWVEPCVRNGHIIPCRCDKIAPAASAPTGSGAYFTSEAEWAAGDDMLLPYIPPGARVGPFDTSGASYPLSAYLDVDALIAEHRCAHVTYAHWCAGERAARGGAAPPWRMPHAYFSQEPDDGPDGAPRESRPVRVGDMRFSGTRSGWRVPFRALSTDASRHMVFFCLARSTLPYRAQPLRFLPAVPVHPGHVEAMQRFAAVRLGGQPFTAFHWRSEQALAEDLDRCAWEMADAAAALRPAAFAPVGAQDGSSARTEHAVLLADMPAPGNPVRAWDDDARVDVLVQQAAAAVLLGRGFVKYDAELLKLRHQSRGNRSSLQVGVAAGASPSGAAAGEADDPLADAGVLSLRDYLLGVAAEQYVTCLGDHWLDCRGCFRIGSNIIARIDQERLRRGLTAANYQWLRRP